MQTVLFLSNASRFQLDPLVEGVRPVARKAHWNLQVIGDVKGHDDVRTLLDFWHPQGCIIQNSTRPDLFVDELFGGLPVVRIDLDPALTGRMLSISSRNGSISRAGSRPCRPGGPRLPA